MATAMIDRCPWCDTLITRSRFVAIEEKIRQEEEKRLAAVEAGLRRDLAKSMETELEERTRLATEQAEKLAAAKSTTLEAECQRLREASQDAEARAVEARAQLEQVAAERVRKAEAERDAAQIQARESAQRERLLKQSVEDEVTRRVSQATSEADLRRQKELTEMRAILTRDKDQEVIRQKAAFNREREGYQVKLKDLERQLQRQTAQELGEGAEIDLFEALVEAFPEDRIFRVPRGSAGADIHHEVRASGDPCGLIVYDSKNRQAWQYSFAEKLRTDQLEAKADHAILTTAAFPSGHRELCIESEVIVVSPARAVAVAQLLRYALIRMRLLTLSTREKATKMGQLYQFMTSESFWQRFREIEGTVQAVLDVDAEEKKAHDRVWRDRGRLLMKQKHLVQELDLEIDGILQNPPAAHTA